jgi:hypothetical protein
LRFFEDLDRQRRRVTPIGHVQRHLFTTVHIDVTDADAAKGIAYAIVYRDEESDGTAVSYMRMPEIVVQYDDIFRRTANGWMIADHQSTHVFREPNYVRRQVDLEADRSA